MSKCKDTIESKTYGKGDNPSGKSNHVSASQMQKIEGKRTSHNKEELGNTQKDKRRKPLLGKPPVGSLAISNVIY